ncbi:acyl-CoA thioesterase [Parerythrobacter jejuensis]|uniref:Acyl-CoA thioesterase n=1 Tax=Parerythrobacter jejuensis TaxID=795812 RepID=A0A845ARN3_9SPHN|nr:acyl-CoA thioesterase [Parerythrobacter jejuensis]MXP31166.1 acyl-CoA thioesterase [Parerythrobacter jejuensis]MXP33926.1 acyl-CoA thioesterase [Parerythrobacter jejuensis]
MSDPFRKSFTATPEHIDEMGHVNNAVWVQWVQDMATAHWDAVAAPEHVRDFVWLVVRHEIDYRGNIAEGETVTGTTWIPDDPRGATSLRRVDFHDPSGKTIVAASTTWAMLDRETQRLARVRPEVIAPFRGEQGT